MRCIWTSYDYVTSRKAYEEMDDLIVGGVVHNRMYEEPRQSKEYQSTKSSIRQVFSNDDTLRLKPFPPPNAQTTDTVGTMMQLPDYVFIHEDAVPRVGVWDEDTETWSEALIDEAPTYDPEKRLLTFELKRFAPIAYLQHRCTDYPYDSWYMRCTAP